MINFKHSKVILRHMIFIGIIALFFTEIIFTTHVLATSLEDTQAHNNGSEPIPFYWMLLIVGGCIGITLSYVSWRKYKGEQKKQKSKDKIID